MHRSRQPDACHSVFMAVVPPSRLSQPQGEPVLLTVG